MIAGATSAGWNIWSASPSRRAARRVRSSGSGLVRRIVSRRDAWLATSLASQASTLSAAAPSSGSSAPPGASAVSMAAAVGGGGPARLHRVARGVEHRRQRAEAGREQRFDALADGFRQPRRRAASADGDSDGGAVDDRGGGEIAEVRAVDDVDEQAAGAEGGGGGARFCLIVDRDEGDGNASFPCLDDPPACALDQAGLGIGSLPFPDHHDGAAGEVQEDGELVHGKILAEMRLKSSPLAGRWQAGGLAEGGGALTLPRLRTRTLHHPSGGPPSPFWGESSQSSPARVRQP